MIFQRTARHSNSQIPRTNEKRTKNNFLILGHGRHQKSPGKGRGKSWNFIRSKEFEPWEKYYFRLQIVFRFFVQCFLRARGKKLIYGRALTVPITSTLKGHIFLKSMFNLIPFSVIVDTQYVANFKLVLNLFLLTYWSYM